MEHHQSIKNAVKWIDSELQHSNIELKKLLQEAMIKFDLNPIDAEFLRNNYK